MSLDPHREAIAAAVSEVDGVKGYPHKPAAPRTGDAWPQWGGSTRAEGWAFIRTWFVLVVLPNGEREASDWADARLGAFVDAMQENDVGYVDQFEPVAIPTSAGDLLALRITMRSE